MENAGGWCLLRQVRTDQSEHTLLLEGGLKETGTKTECSDRGRIEVLQWDKTMCFLKIKERKCFLAKT